MEGILHNMHVLSRTFRAFLALRRIHFCLHYYLDAARGELVDIVQLVGVFELVIFVACLLWRFL